MAAISVTTSRAVMMNFHVEDDDFLLRGRREERERAREERCCLAINMIEIEKCVEKYIQRYAIST